MREFLLAVGVASLVLPATAQAHFNLLAPPSSNTANAKEGGKGAPPCGPDSTPANTPTPVQGGQMLTLKIDEWVTHPGHYRVALALHSRSELPADPMVTSAANGDSTGAVIDATPDFPVIADGLWVHTGAIGMYEGKVKIPNVNCDKCTLQVIEYMDKHGPNPGGGYFYHHCADVKITADPNLPLEHSGGGAGGAASGGASGAAGAAGAIGAAAGTGGTAGTGATSAGAGGAFQASAGAASAGAAASAGSNSAGTSSAGTSAAGSSTAGSSAAGATSVPVSGPAADDGGCSLTSRGAGSGPLLSLLLGLFALGRRRSRRG